VAGLLIFGAGMEPNAHAVGHNVIAVGRQDSESGTSKWVGGSNGRGFILWPERFDLKDRRVVIICGAEFVTCLHTRSERRGFSRVQHIDEGDQSPLMLSAVAAAPPLEGMNRVAGVTEPRPKVGSRRPFVMRKILPGCVGGLPCEGGSNSGNDSGEKTEDVAGSHEVGLPLGGFGRGNVTGKLRDLCTGAAALLGALGGFLLFNRRWRAGGFCTLLGIGLLLWSGPQ
jgi:hypothetical protein